MVVQKYFKWKIASKGGHCSQTEEVVCLHVSDSALCEASGCSGSFDRDDGRRIETFNGTIHRDQTTTEQSFVAGCPDPRARTCAHEERATSNKM